MSRARLSAVHGLTVTAMKRTRPLAGWSGLAILLSGLGPLSAQTLMSENFDAAAPGGALTNLLPGTGLRVTSGNVDVIGTILNGALISMD